MKKKNARTPPAGGCPGYGIVAAGSGLAVLDHEPQAERDELAVGLVVLHARHAGPVVGALHLGAVAVGVEHDFRHGRVIGGTGYIPFD